ncbi:MAG: plasmid pRiA4b ORF-3 family protein [Bacteroidia bacterium]|jgi:hypothetical protein|nr:plasmid pRiA4b ORF-3 family protein [Bacteroidia bacterium]
MAVYRFRIWFEDQEDIYREIDVQTKQSFADLHRCIQEAIGFDNSKDASFFISDDFWRKGREIALNPKQQDDDDDDDWRRPKKPAPISMRDARIADYIDDPHQKILYLFDPQALWTFCIELIRIVEDEPKTVYPKVSKSVGAAPRQYKVNTPPPDVDEDEDLLDDDEPQKERAFVADEKFGDDHDSDAFGEEGEEAGEEGEESAEGSEEEAADFGFEGGDSHDDY